MIKKDL